MGVWKVRATRVGLGPPWGNPASGFPHIMWEGLSPTFWGKALLRISLSKTIILQNMVPVNALRMPVL